MHVIVIGAGIIGVTSAYFLRRRGFEVTVLDEAHDVAQATSLGNAGIIAPGYVTPWAAPGMPAKILSYLFKAEAPLVFRPTLRAAQWRWIARWLRECDLARYRVNKERMQRIAHYSRSVLHELRQRHAIAYAQSQGYLQLFRSDQDIELNAPARKLLTELGVRFELLAPQDAYVHAPGLNPSTALAGALYLPDDEAGSCPMFAQALRRICEADGVAFRFGRRVAAIERAGGAATGVRLKDDSRLAGDTVVVAAAFGSLPLLAPLGIDVPIYPVKGYSATATMRAPKGERPTCALMDEAYKTAITPFDDEVRIAGTAEIGSPKLALRASALRTLLKVARDWYPDLADWTRCTTWTGARPMVPDGPPILGATPLKNLYLNLGHGSTGWAMSAGSGKALADLIAGRPPEVDLEGLTLERYGRAAA